MVRPLQPWRSMNASAQPVPCPKCRVGMTFVTVTPHPVVPDMQRTTFVCYVCNQTRTYMLKVDALELPAR